jgi:hypothetical protein
MGRDRISSLRIAKPGAIFDGWLYAATILYNKKKVERIQAFVAAMNKTLFAWHLTSK